MLSKLRLKYVRYLGDEFPLFVKAKEALSGLRVDPNDATEFGLLRNQPHVSYKNKTIEKQI